jgi:hypothetical protein
MVLASSIPRGGDPEVPASQHHSCMVSDYLSARAGIRGNAPPTVPGI